MRSAILVIYYLTILSVVCALVVPVRRVQIHDPKVQHIRRGIHKRHTRFVKRQILKSFSDISTAIASDIGDLGDFPGYVITLVPATTTPQQSPTPVPMPTSQISSSLLPSPAGSSVSVISTAAPQGSSSTIAVPAPTDSTLPATSSTTSASSTRFVSRVSSSTSLPQASASSIPIPQDNDGSQKYVVAHHMVGNTYPYTIDDWADDIALAHASGIDGFALNCGSDEWEPARVADAYEAAKRSGLNFKLFISLDMTSLPCSSPDDASRLREFVKPYFNHPNQLQYDSRAFVSSFAGETCTFGGVNVVEGWKSQFVQQGDILGKIYFVPAFFVDPTKFSDFSEVMSGDFNWNSGWPVKVTTSFAQNLVASLPNNATSKSSTPDATVRIANVALDNVFGSLASAIPAIEPQLNKFIGSTETDDEHLRGLETLHGTLRARNGEAKKPVYMGAVSPWFFTHYGKDSFNKNWIFLSDQHLYAKRWESIISSRDQFDIIQVLTWNDYGESHYVGPIKGSQPNSEAWVNGFNHTGWLELTQYYATAYKTGAFPTIDKDKIFLWSRPHPSQAKTSDPVGQPDNFELSQDAVWAMVMTTGPSTVILSTDPQSKNAQQFQVPAGVSKLSVPITPGGTMKGAIQRDGRTIVELAPHPEEFTFQGSPTTYNFNAFVASATAE